MKKLNIIFAGTPDFAVPALQALIDAGHTVMAVYTQPDRPSGRGQQLHESPVKQLAQKYNLPVFQPDKLQEFSHDNIDVLIVAAYGLIIPEFILKIPKYGCLNVHGSLLPRWRGAAPLHRALLAGDKETGITIMQMDKGLDTGDILYKKSYAILPTDNIQTLNTKLADIGAEALIHVLNDINNIKPEKQDNISSTYAKKLEKSEGTIDWTKSAKDINGQIRAFYPAHTYIDNQLVKIWESEIIDKNTTKTPGEILTKDLEIATGDKIIKVLKLQLPGGKPLNTKDLLNSRAQLFAEGKIFKGE